MIKFRLILILSTLCLCEIAWGTAQTPEKIIYLGKEHELLSAPLELLYEQADSIGIQLPNFELSVSGSDTTIAMNTGNWRGYVATWEIARDSLYLIGIDDGKYDLSKIFGDKFIDGKVMADWYTGDLRIADGALINYIHMGFMSTYKKETVVVVEKGIVISVQEYENKSQDPPRGYIRMVTPNLTADVPKSLHACYDQFSDTLCLTDKKGNLNFYGFTVQEPLVRLNKSAQKIFVASKIDSCAQLYNGHFTFSDPVFEGQRYGYVGWINAIASDSSGMMRILVMSNLHSRLFVFILIKGDDQGHFDKMTDIFCHSLVLTEFGY